jgi:tol-pal system protein YbgF
VGRLNHGEDFMAGLRLALLFLVLAAWGCASTGTPVMGDTQGDASHEWRLRNLEEHFLEFQEAQRRQETDVQQRLEAQENRLAHMDRTLEEVAGRSRELSAEMEVLKSAMSAREHAQSMPRPLEKGMEPTQAMEAPAPMKETPPAMKETPPAPMKKASPAPMAKPAPAKSMGAGRYAQAVELAMAGKSEPARAELNDFLAANPKSPLVPNALYWLGETYYHDGRYAQSILTFKEVTRRFPKHDKAAAALLKIGYAYERLGDMNNARFNLQALVDEYPASGPASLARTKLGSLPR